jgi:hypothetical protein
LPVFNESLAKGDYKEAQKIAEQQIGRENSPHDLLWNLQSGSMARHLKDYPLSNTFFDRAEEDFRHYDLRISAAGFTETSAAFLLNDSAAPYKGKIHDRIMVNTYKALNYAVLGDFKNARVEFNRALQRQNDAKTTFAAQAAALQDRLAREKEKQGPGASAVDSTLNNPELDQILKDRYKNLDKFKVYADFVNPFTTYMAGLFFWLEGSDIPKAVDVLKEAYGMNDRQTVLASDFARAARGDRPHNELWVIFENGLCPSREEMRVDLPVFIYTDIIQYIGTAFPAITAGKDAYPSLSISAQGVTPVKTELLAAMDSVIAAEFKKDLPGIILREVTRVALKTFLQYKMRKEYGTLGAVLSGVYHAVSTAADTRMWTALPNNFQAAHLKIPESRTVIVSLSPGRDITINLPPGENNMILYARVVAPDVPPVYDFIQFQENRLQR